MMTNKIEELLASINELESRQAMLKQQLDECTKELNAKKDELEKLNRLVEIIDGWRSMDGNENVSLQGESTKKPDECDNVKPDTEMLTENIMKLLSQKRNWDKVDSEKKDGDAIVGPTESGAVIKKTKIAIVKPILSDAQNDVGNCSVSIPSTEGSDVMDGDSLSVNASASENDSLSSNVSESNSSSESETDSEEENQRKILNLMERINSVQAELNSLQSGRNRVETNRVQERNNASGADNLQQVDLALDQPSEPQANDVMEDDGNVSPPTKDVQDSNENGGGKDDNDPDGAGGLV